MFVFHIISVNLEEECDYSTRLLNSVEGEIRFHLDRGERIHCVATLEVPPKMNVLLQFEEFYLDATDTSICDDTWLMLYDGIEAKGGRELVLAPGLCGDDSGGSRLPTKIYTTENSLTIWLSRTTKQSRSAMDFRIYFMAFKTYSDDSCFKCEDSSVDICIDESLLCDHNTEHCPDGSDEDLRICKYTDLPSEDSSNYLLGMRIANIIGITVGVVIFLLVFIMIVTCCCRVNASSNTNAPLPTQTVSIDVRHCTVNNTIGSHAGY
ncbi:uncharacterized protein LOC144353337 [Saccoglossus kowalevskii]